MDTEIRKIGIIICQRYQSCAGGKCFRALREREGAFKTYPKENNIEVVGYTGCGGCPGGNVEYAPEEMIRNGAQVIHLATGLVVGYPPCPRLDYFRRFIEERYRIPVIIGTHPIPEKYFLIHERLKTWQDKNWIELLKDLQDPRDVRLAYN